ncbi:MAG: hypothetical protein AABX05_01325 [Nanoarchaeota archaeon]
MAYRENALETVLRARHEEAKGTLERTVKQKEYTFSELEDALNELGFQKQKLTLHPTSQGITAYVRENEAGLEVLTDSIYDHDRSTILTDGIYHHGRYDRLLKNPWCLYQVPKGVTVNDWYNKIIPVNIKKQRQAGAISYVVGSTAFAATFTNLLPLVDGYFKFTLFLLSSLVVNILAVVGSYSYLTKKSALHDQLIAKGPKALRHIADNSQYQSPRLRIEAKSEIIDAEFTADEIYEQTVLEAQAEPDKKYYQPK